MTRARYVLSAALLLLPACIDIDFEPPHLVQTPRILAITATPPEAAFGEDILVEALVLDADGSELSAQPDVELEWTVCLSLREIVAAAGLGAGTGLEDDCDEGGDDLVRLETEGLPSHQARLPGAAFFRLAGMLMGGETPTPTPDGGGLDPRLLETLTLVLAEVGVPLRARLVVRRAGAVILTGFKRFAVTNRESPTTNPPPPRFQIGETWLSARADGGEPRRCVSEEGARPVVDASAEIEITPDPDEDAWIESYPVFNLSGELQTNVESAYYSWFSTAGAFSDDITQRPLRDVEWTAPEAAGVYPIWLVVRDGHLGISYCEAEVEVR